MKKALMALMFIMLFVSVLLFTFVGIEKFHIESEWGRIGFFAFVILIHVAGCVALWRFNSFLEWTREMHKKSAFVAVIIFVLGNIALHMLILGIFPTDNSREKQNSHSQAVQVAQNNTQQSGHKTITEQLLGEELNKFTMDENGWTHLHWAAAANDSESVIILLSMTAGVNITDLSNGSDFSFKGKNRFKVLENEENQWENDGYTPLLVAMRFMSWKIVALLLENGADANVKTKDGRTPLHWAAHRDAYKVARLLLNKGADDDVKSKDGGTPLHWAAYYNARETALLLLKKSAGDNVKGKDGETPLHWAARRNGARETALMLLKNGADVNAKDNSGKTPLDWAEENNAQEMAALLKEKGGNIGQLKRHPDLEINSRMCRSQGYFENGFPTICHEAY